MSGIWASNHLFGGRSIELGASHQPFELDARRAGHHHDGIAQGFTTGFIEKRNVSKKKIVGVAPAFGFEAPLTADARMQDLLQRAFLFRVGEHYGAQSGPDSSRRWQNKSPGQIPRADQLPHLRIALRQIARGLVGIKKCRGGKKLAADIRKKSSCPWKSRL